MVFTSSFIFLLFSLYFQTSLDTRVLKVSHISYILGIEPSLNWTADGWDDRSWFVVIEMVVVVTVKEVVVVVIMMGRQIIVSWSFVDHHCSSWFIAADLIVRDSFIVRSKISIDLSWLWFVGGSCDRLTLLAVVVTAVVISILWGKLDMFDLYAPIWEDVRVKIWFLFLLGYLFILVFYFDLIFYFGLISYFDFLLQIEHCIMRIILVLLGLDVFLSCNSDAYIFRVLPTLIIIWSSLHLFSLISSPHYFQTLLDLWRTASWLYRLIYLTNKVYFPTS